MIKITNVLVTDFAQNCRIIGDVESKSAAVVDPGGDVPKILKALKDGGWECQQIWLTHSHLDHCGGVKELKDLTGAILYAHPIEKEMRAHVTDICAMYGLPVGMMQNCPEPDHYIEGGSELKIGDNFFTALFTPGHSPGHLSLYNASAKVVLGGDALFAGSIGRTDLPGGDHPTLIDAIRRELFTLPEDTVVLSGHGPDTTIGEEKRTNPFFGDM